MSNVPILSNTTSALFNTLSENSSLDNYTYRLNQPWPNNSKSKIHVLPNQPMAFNSQTTFRIPRFGLLQAAALKVQINLGDNSGDQINVPDYPYSNQPLAVNSTSKLISDDFALFLCSRIALVSHTREIEVLTPYGSLAKYYALPREQQIALSDAMQRGFDPRGGGDMMNVVPAQQPKINGIATLNPAPVGFGTVYKDQSVITYYIPLFFSFAAHLHSAIDSSFLEELEIVCDVAPQTDLMSHDLLPGTSAGAPNAPVGCTIQSAEMLLYFHNLPNKQQRALQNTQYNLRSSQPLTVLYSNCYEETPVSFNPGFGANQGHPAVQDNYTTVTLNLSCKHLIYQTIIACELNPNLIMSENRRALRGPNSQADIVSAELFMSGRSVWKTTTVESCCLEAGLLHGCNPRGRERGIKGGQGSDGVQNDTRTLTISWTNDMRKALAEMSGALSLKGASSPQLVLTIRPVVATWDGTIPNYNRPFNLQTDQISTHTVYVNHLFYSATSFSGADGRISQGLNL